MVDIDTMARQLITLMLNDRLELARGRGQSDLQAIQQLELELNSCGLPCQIQILNLPTGAQIAVHLGQGPQGLITPRGT